MSAALPLRTNRRDRVFFGTRAVLPHTLAAGRGVILNTASQAALLAADAASFINDAVIPVDDGRCLG
ncbi:MAG: hypothetical protein ACRYHQ_25575 [Janthinobacterium lividum]